jgi:hypothetical protein
MGRKRKDASSAAPLAARKRRQPEQASGGWASLANDIVGVVSDLLLDGDVADYIVFRAICSAWRVCTPSPCEPRHRPRDWIALCDGDTVRPDDAREIDLLNTRTARRLRVRLPELRRYMIVCFSDGLLVLLHKRRAVVRVLNPLTRAAVDFPSLASVYHKYVRDMYFFHAMNAAVCLTASSMAVVVWFPFMPVVVAEAGSDHWEILHQNLNFKNTLLFQERLYGIVLNWFEIILLVDDHQSVMWFRTCISRGYDGFRNIGALVMHACIRAAINSIRAHIYIELLFPNAYVTAGSKSSQPASARARASFRSHLFFFFSRRSLGRTSNQQPECVRVTSRL